MSSSHFKFELGDLVQVISGKYLGKMGIITEIFYTGWVEDDDAMHTEPVYTVGDIYGKDEMCFLADRLEIVFTK